MPYGEFDEKDTEPSPETCSPAKLLKKQLEAAKEAEAAKNAPTEQPEDAPEDTQNEEGAK